MKKLLLLIAIFTTNLGSARADIPSIHGMLLFGQETNYASHLPMFHAPHDYQLLMELEFKEVTGSKALELYAELKKEEHKLFTLVPEKMDLSLVISGEKSNFSAHIFKDHFERGGENLGAVQVKVSKIIFSDTLDPDKTTNSQEEYFVFGKEGEYFAAHVIGGAPNFDAIVSVEKPYHLDFPHCRTRVCDDVKKKPVKDDSLPLTLGMTAVEEPYKLPKVGDSLGFFFGPMTSIQEILYFEEAELSHPDHHHHQ